MTIWIFLLCVVCGVVMAIVLARHAYHRRPARTRRKSMRYLKPYEPVPAPSAPSTGGSTCD